MKKAIHLIVITAVTVFIVAAVGFSFVGCKTAHPMITVTTETTSPASTS